MTDSIYIDRLRDAVDELVAPRTAIVSEPYWDSMRHRKFRIVTVLHNPLLVDLALAVAPGKGVVEMGGKPGSRPPARLDAIDELSRIKGGVLEWLAVLMLASRMSVAADLRMFVGIGLTLPESMLARLSRDAMGWALGARIVTGWESPAFAPNVPCPACESTSALRIYPAQRAGRCVRCGAIWNDADGGFGVLVEHVRFESEGMA